jgi:hypothetical protein
MPRRILLLFSCLFVYVLGGAELVSADCWPFCPPGSPPQSGSRGYYLAPEVSTAHLALTSQDSNGFTFKLFRSPSDPSSCDATNNLCHSINDPRLNGSPYQGTTARVWSNWDVSAFRVTADANNLATVEIHFTAHSPWHNAPEHWSPGLFFRMYDQNDVQFGKDMVIHLNDFEPQNGYFCESDGDNPKTVHGFTISGSDFARLSSVSFSAIADYYRPCKDNPPPIP